MKKLMTILLIINAQFLYGQISCDDFCSSFEDTTCLTHLTIDTTTVPNNLWQIGRPQKPLFNSASSPANAIVTDTINSYPINNYSVFTIRNLATMGDIYGLNTFQGAYNVQSDTLHDYGRMEFSPDLGATWIDLFNDTVYHVVIWYSQVPVLSGNSNGWKYFSVLLADLGSVFNIHLGDTLLYRFTFTSDSIANNLGGLMYDDFCFYSWVEGVTETHFKPIKSKIYPNPSTNIFLIEFENTDPGLFELSVYDIHSKLILKKENITENKIIVDAKLFNPGTYIYKLTNLKAKKRSWGKFIKTE